MPWYQKHEIVGKSSGRSDSDVQIDLRYIDESRLDHSFSLFYLSLSF